MVLHQFSAAGPVLGAFAMLAAVAVAAAVALSSPRRQDRPGGRGPRR